MTKTALLLAALLVAASASAQTVKLQTSEGDIRIELNAEKAPKSVANFLQYVKAGHYNGVIFHRVIPSFMVQTGGYDAKLNQRPTKPPIPLEASNGLSNLRGSIAMARTGDPNSATSQFFINVVDNPYLDADPANPRSGYAVFGQVVEGMDVVDKIRTAETAARGIHENLPLKPIFITKALVEPVKKMSQVKLTTNHGDILIELDAEKAPLSVANFLQYVRAGHYDGTVFHRVIKGFMIQGGGFEQGMKQKPTEAPIQNEANNGLKNAHYTLAMARTNAPHSATAQFFINTTNNGFLDFKSESPSGWGYAVFGKVVEGQDIVDKIEKVKTGRSGFHDDVPVEAVVIEKAVEV